MWLSRATLDIIGLAGVYLSLKYDDALTYLSNRLQLQI